MKKSTLTNEKADIFGSMYIDGFQGTNPEYYSIERDDGYIDTDNEIGIYFQPYYKWSQVDKNVLKFVQGKILDIGAGAGRHSLYFQENGYEVHALDNSVLAQEVMKCRGIKNIYLQDICKIEEIGFMDNYFDTVLMLFNNFGLTGSREKTKELLMKLHKITSPKARIISVGVDPYASKIPEHVNYNKKLSEKGTSGLIKLRIIYRNITGPWYVLLMLSSDELKDFVKTAGWKVIHCENLGKPTYGAIIAKK